MPRRGQIGVQILRGGGLFWSFLMGFEGILEAFWDVFIAFGGCIIINDKFYNGGVFAYIMKIVSACLAGTECRYNGGAVPCQTVMELVKQGKAIPVCPEQLGGLPTPRTPSEQVGNKILTKDGEDVTEQFEKGAEEALKIAKLANCKEAILKAKSPSYGHGQIYDGTFTGGLVSGDGVFAKLLKKNNIKVLTEDQI